MKGGRKLKAIEKSVFILFNSSMNVVDDCWVSPRYLWWTDTSRLTFRLLDFLEMISISIRAGARGAVKWSETVLTRIFVIPEGDQA